MLLTRDERRLSVAHHGLLLWIGSSKGNGFVRRNAAAQRGAEHHDSQITHDKSPQTRLRYNLNRKAWARANARRPHRGNTVSPQELDPQTWMAGSSPAMTERVYGVCPNKNGRVIRPGRFKLRSADV